MGASPPLVVQDRGKVDGMKKLDTKPECYAKIWEDGDSECAVCVLETDCRRLTKRSERAVKEEEAKEAAIQHHIEDSSDLVDFARDIALELARRNPDREVCSEDIWEEIRDRISRNAMWFHSKMTLEKRVKMAHPTWMGAVFRSPLFESTEKHVKRGSHHRPIRVWKLRGDWR